jgi:ribosomal-protein-alanine N-acetyltransferase
MNTEVFEMFPVLSTSRLVLREMSPDDAPGVFAVFGDDEVTHFYDTETMTNIAEAHAMIDRMRSRFTQKVGIRWAITDASDAYLGSVGFNSFTAWAHRAVLGYELARHAWGQGLATEAVRAVVAFGQERLGVNRIEATTMLGNEASVAVLRKVGFQEEGLLRAYGYWKGRYHDLRMFSIVQGDLRR